MKDWLIQVTYVSPEGMHGYYSEVQQFVSLEAAMAFVAENYEGYHIYRVSIQQVNSII